MNYLSLIGGLTFFFLFLSIGNANNLDCLRFHSKAPCNGASGSCFTNADGSLGGFVADTVKIAKKSWIFFQVPLPYIAPGAQVCDYAKLKVKQNQEVIIDDEAIIRGHAEISGNSRISGSATVSDYARVHHGQIRDFAQVYGAAKIIGVSPSLFTSPPTAMIRGHAHVFGEAEVLSDPLEGNPLIDNHARVFGKASVRGYVHISDWAQVYDCSCVSSQFISGIGPVAATLYGKVQVFGYAQIVGGHVCGKSQILGHAKVFGPGVKILDFSKIYGDAIVRSKAVRIPSRTQKDLYDVTYPGGGLIGGFSKIHGNALVEDRSEDGRTDRFFVVNEEIDKKHQRDMGRQIQYEPPLRESSMPVCRWNHGATG